ncbi:DNA topoisomerase IB [Planosporangium flavigriseum]|uniref:DNA topoisomerase n=1 Tax=Planosporangium flavigriseum TaxID=373681 RepID=A0A8J3PPV1_9ACTN|nr:DNA topoisomerase IB [Planosporangium flavigriseum]NJC63403.1 DNA topoisomerase IB [Planosporangium flavigriseum]GIG75386.1 DNA topoisomerase [Planosporangium flavigriseum]
MRLRRADPNRSGYTRRRRGKGFTYLDADGRVITDPDVIARIRALAIPPAWVDVWICPDPCGHIQATGVDQAGRRQYRYHDVWRAKRDAEKFEHIRVVGEHLPQLRKRVAGDLARRGLCRERVLAAAVRLLDQGVFRIGGEAYASADSSAGEPTYGLATIQRDHVSVRGATMEFRYPAKGGIERAQRIVDDEVAPVVRALLKRPDPNPELLGYRVGSRGPWRDVRSADINDYLKDATACDISAKDFRTWHATVLACVSLASPEALDAKSATARKRAVSRAMREVSEHLGNTPAVAKASYVNPRVVDLYHAGETIAAALSAIPRACDGFAARHEAEQAVLQLLNGGPG